MINLRKAVFNRVRFSNVKHGTGITIINAMFLWIQIFMISEICFALFDDLSGPKAKTNQQSQPQNACIRELNEVWRYRAEKIQRLQEGLIDDKQKYQKKV